MDMDISGSIAGKSPSASLSFRYNANNEKLEELFDAHEDGPLTPLFDASSSTRSESASPKKVEKVSILDKYFKKAEKTEGKPIEHNDKGDDSQISYNSPKETSSSPMKDYLNRLGRKSISDPNSEIKEPNETWKLFQDFKCKIAQAVEDMKTRSTDDPKEKSIIREISISDSEENSVVKDSDPSFGDTDNQVSSLESSIQNLSEMTQPLTAKLTVNETEAKTNNSNSSEETHKNLYNNETGDTKPFSDKPAMEVESGVEALEDLADILKDETEAEEICQPCQEPRPPLVPRPIFRNNLNNLPPNKINSVDKSSIKDLIFDYTMLLLTFILLFLYITFPECKLLLGFLFGIWLFCLVSNLKQWLFDTYIIGTEEGKRSKLKSNGMSASYTIPSIKEHGPIKIYEGWINQHRYPEYDPYTYSVNRTRTAFMKLEGTNLRISYTKTKIAKRAVWDETIEKVEFYQHRLYNLTGATVELLPKGLVRKRHWSKKYPICVRLSDKEKVQVLEKECLDSPVHRTPRPSQNDISEPSPEKKKKFVWRRWEKSVSEAEPTKAGIRHRIARKMHREKKSDSVTPTSASSPTVEHQDKESLDKTLPASSSQDDWILWYDAEPEPEMAADFPILDELEDLEKPDQLQNMKEFFEETDLDVGIVEGEWSSPGKRNLEAHRQLFLFGRTGREKFEWYRRIMTAIANAKTEAAPVPTADKKVSTETLIERETDKANDIEVSYKPSDKDNILFKTVPQPKAELDDPITNITMSPTGAALGLDAYDKAFWPFLLKIIATKPVDNECDCRLLPAEMTWLNMLAARFIYDIIRNQTKLKQLQIRVQKKLDTLKLPSFMSPLIVTEISLAGACPLIERVMTPTWDEEGVWFEVDLRYEGGAYINILTQINLMALKIKNVSAIEDQLLAPDMFKAKNTLVNQNRKLAMFDSSVEDSAESSEDDETNALQDVDNDFEDLGDELNQQSSSDPQPQQPSQKKKFLRMVDKIATNKYFQTVTDYKYIKRAMEGVSNTDIKLQLEVQALEGRAVVNIPPPPHDRVWIGFRTNPHLTLKARPAVGTRSLRFGHVSNWIEQKLAKEFEKILVLPNMEDFMIDLMSPTPV